MCGLRDCALGIDQAGHRDVCAIIMSAGGTPVTMSLCVDPVGMRMFLMSPAADVGSDFVSPEFTARAWPAVACCFPLFMPLCVHFRSIHWEPSVVC